MDIENEIQVLRDQLAEKSSDSVHILKKVYILNRTAHIIMCVFGKPVEFYCPFTFQILL